MQTIKDLPFQMKHCYLILRKRRYVCSCGKRFYEDYTFIPRYLQRTSRLTAFIADSLHDTRSISSVAKMWNVSTATVNRILDTISFEKPKIPQVLSIDEFKGNADGQKYQCILVDPVKHSVLDILPSRSQTHLTSYFREIPRSERYRVNFFVCDMWKPYTELAQTFSLMLPLSLINTTLSDRLHGLLKTSANEFRKPCLLPCVSIINAAIPLSLPVMINSRMKRKRNVT